MKSTFGSKRKARKIEVDEEDEGRIITPGEHEQVKTVPTANVSGAGKKSFKKSSLRQSITFGDELPNSNDTFSAGTSSLQSANKASIGRSSSMKKRKPASSRLSFGPGEIISGDAAESLEDDEAFTPRKTTLGRRIVENSALRNSVPAQGLPGRDDDNERPTYSKDYLNQLKSSTPTTPKDLQNLNVDEESEQGLDISEMEGAVIVNVDEGSGTTSIPTDAEIREKKERRARLAHEEDFISLNDDSDNRRELSLLPKKKKEDTRLVRDDEDLGEGFDEFVDDGKIALGKKQERETRRRHQKEMADMIQLAEGNSNDESDDSEAERRAAYEAAQTRAGMDGLHKPTNDVETRSAQIPSKITSLPILSECLSRLQSTLSSMELELARKRKKMNDLKLEKDDIAAREVEVQELLRQAGSRYSALKADSNGAVSDHKTLLSSSVSSPIVVDRGLESFGNTPTFRRDVEDVG